MARVFTAVLHKEDDLYVAECPEVGTVSQGYTIEEATLSLSEATALYLEEKPMKMDADVIIPHPLSEAAERLARQLGMSLSDLHTTALTAFIAKYSEDDVTTALNRVYTGKSSSLDPVLMKMQMISLGEETW